jgi:hypothetical protein
MITSNENLSTSDTESCITRVSIACNAAKGEIVTTVQHTPETFRIGDASDNRSDERITIQTRQFPVYAATPGVSCQALARSMRAEAMRRLPSVPVELFGA